MQKLVSLLLSVLLLASSANITYAKHFCGGEVVMSALSLGETYLSCSEKEDVPSCDDKKESKNSCCKTKYDQVDVDDNFDNPTYDIVVELPIKKEFSNGISVPVITLDQKAFAIYAYYDPPPLDKDVRTLYQVFRI